MARKAKQKKAEKQTELPPRLFAVQTSAKKTPLRIIQSEKELRDFLEDVGTSIVVGVYNLQDKRSLTVERNPRIIGLED